MYRQCTCINTALCKNPTEVALMDQNQQLTGHAYLTDVKIQGDCRESNCIHLYSIAPLTSWLNQVHKSNNFYVFAVVVVSKNIKLFIFCQSYSIVIILMIRTVLISVCKQQKTVDDPNSTIKFHTVVSLYFRY